MEASCDESNPAESTRANDLSVLEGIIGYKFENIKLLEEAFTHVSFVPENGVVSSYDRLEYVGDAVLNLLFSKEQYFAYPELSSGQLTRLRASNVDTEKLARVAVRHGLHHYLRHNKPLLENQVSSLFFFYYYSNIIFLAEFLDFLFFFFFLGRLVSSNVEFLYYKSDLTF